MLDRIVAPFQFSVLLASAALIRQAFFPFSSVVVYVHLYVHSRSHGA
ncbi:hypothetical protein [Bradyrhizobium sp. UFLA03-84]|nr:hypothetical protein [Bradyrhizobium sp. UFLA03-84]